jgi:hypothetical protein
MPALPDALADRPHEMQVARRRLRRDEDWGVANVLTATSWLLQCLPAQVLDHQRGELLRALAEAAEAR